MTLRALQAALLLLVVGGAVAFWTELPHPGTFSVEDTAAAPLRRIFQEELRYGEMEIDLVDGIRVRDLRVPSSLGLAAPSGAPGTTPRAVDGFMARRIEIRPDTLALSTGTVALRSVTIEGARIILSETEQGLEPDFPFELPETRGKAPPPELRLSDAWLYIRSRPGSTRFREGAVVVLYVERLTVRPERSGALRVSGTVFTRELGQDDEPLRISGRVDRGRQMIDLRVDIEHLELTPNLLALLAEEVAAPLRQESIKSGRLGVSLTGPPGGEARMQIEWDADVEVQVDDIPGIEQIEATTKEQLQELFGRGVLKILVDQDEVRIDQLVTQMAGGRVEATGWVKHETGAMQIDFTIEDLELSDPAVRRALGESGALLFDQFSPSGIVDAKGTVSRAAGGEIEWRVDVVLEDTRFEFIGHVGEDGKRVGFPYSVEQATGRVFLRPEGVYFEDIVGFHRGAEITIRGRDKKAWGGGETGRILFTDAGADIRLTVEVVNMGVDEDLTRAVEGSEFAGLFDTFQLAGVIDLVEIDVVRVPGIDEFSKAELRLQLEGEQFKYAPFPIPVEDVRGTITARRPLLPGTEGEGTHRRGNVIAFDVTGWLEGAPLRARAEIVGHEDTGRLHIEADGVPLAGALTRTILTSETTGEGLAPVWRWLEPRGRADVNASIPLRDDPKPMELTTTLKGASIRLAAETSPAPIELTDLSGELVVDGDDVRLSDVRGLLGGSRTVISGSMLGGTEGRWDLEIEAEPVRITPGLLAGLGHLTTDGELLPDGMRFETGGRLGFSAHITREPGPDAELELDLTARDIDVDVRLPTAGAIHVMGDEIHVGPETIDVRGITVEAEGLAVEMPAARIPREAGRLSGRFVLRMDEFEADAGLLDLLSATAAELIGDWTKDRLLSSDGLVVDAPEAGPVRLDGPLSLVAPEGVAVGDGPRGALRLDALLITTDDAGTLLGGRVVLQGFSIDVGVELTELYGAVHLDRLRLGDAEGGHGRLVDVRGRIEDIRVEDLDAPIHWQDGVLRADPITARVADGAFEGHLFVHTREPIAYEGAARVTDFDLARLQEDLSPTGAPVSGTGNARIQFQSRGGTLRDLTAAGTLRIRDGSLGDLPLVATIFALGASITNQEERPQFERADVEFVLKDEVFTLKRIDLAGPLFDMPGRGTLDTTGVVDLYFTPDFIKSLVLPGVMQLPVIGDVVGGVLREELLYAVRVHGDMANAETEIIPLPPLGIRFRSSFEGTGPRKLPPRRVPRWFR